MSARDSRTKQFLLPWAVLLFVASTPGGALAQVAWETPRLIGPESPLGFGVLWTRFGTHPEDGDGLMAVWPTGGLPPGVSIRMGSAGVGLGAGDYALLTVPVGVSAGRAWGAGSVWVAPYVATGLAMDFAFGSDAPEREFEVSPSVDVGIDLSFDRGRAMVVRVGTALGDRHAVAVGVSTGPGRR